MLWSKLSLVYFGNCTEIKTSASVESDLVSLSFVKGLLLCSVTCNVRKCYVNHNSQCVLELIANSMVPLKGSRMSTGQGTAFGGRIGVCMGEIQSNSKKLSKF